MPSLTDPQIDAARDAEALVRLLIDAGEELPPRLHERILTLGPAVIPPLVAMLEDDALSMEEAPGEGWAPIHAADLLGELRKTETVEPMLRRLAETDWDTILHDRLIQALPLLGPSVLEPALAAHAVATDPHLRHIYASITAKLGIHDDRIYQLLVEELVSEMELGAMHLADYGDDRALPLLSAALDQHEAVDNDDLMANHVVVEIEAAIKMLGGQLTPEQQEKVERIYALDQPKREAFAALLDRAAGRTALKPSPIRGAHALHSEPQTPRAARKVGRNAPCPCGSGKKYKKCCLGKE